MTTIQDADMVLYVPEDLINPFSFCDDDLLKLKEIDDRLIHVFNDEPKDIPPAGRLPPKINVERNKLKKSMGQYPTSTIAITDCGGSFVDVAELNDNSLIAIEDANEVSDVQVNSDFDSCFLTGIATENDQLEEKTSGAPQLEPRLSKKDNTNSNLNKKHQPTNASLNRSATSNNSSSSKCPNLPPIQNNSIKKPIIESLDANLNVSTSSHASFCISKSPGIVPWGWRSAAPPNEPNVTGSKGRRVPKESSLSKTMLSNSAEGVDDLSSAPKTGNPHEKINRKSNKMIVSKNLQTKKENSKDIGVTDVVPFVSANEESVSLCEVSSSGENNEDYENTSNVVNRRLDASGRYILEDEENDLIADPDISDASIRRMQQQQVALAVVANGRPPSTLSDVNLNDLELSPNSLVKKRIAECERKAENKRNLRLKIKEEMLEKLDVDFSEFVSPLDASRLLHEDILTVPESLTSEIHLDKKVVHNSPLHKDLEHHSESVTSKHSPIKNKDTNVAGTMRKPTSATVSTDANDELQHESLKSVLEKLQKEEQQEISDNPMVNSSSAFFSRILSPRQKKDIEAEERNRNFDEFLNSIDDNDYASFIPENKMKRDKVVIGNDNKNHDQFEKKNESEYAMTSAVDRLAALLSSPSIDDYDNANGDHATEGNDHKGDKIMKTKKTIKSQIHLDDLASMNPESLNKEQRKLIVQSLVEKSKRRHEEALRILGNEPNSSSSHNNKNDPFSFSADDELDTEHYKKLRQQNNKSSKIDSNRASLSGRLDEVEREVCAMLRALGGDFVDCGID